MKNIYRLQGQVMNYSWGGFEFIPKLIGFHRENHKSYAEYWMGAHQNAPSKLVLHNGQAECLDKLIEINPLDILGQAVTQKYKTLPYLFKILDVRDTLSIQVHPNQQQAEIGFSRENKEGVPIEAPHRNYKDQNGKPELMVALSDFWLLHGFLEEHRLVNVLRNTPEFNTLLPSFEKEGFSGLYKMVMELPSEDIQETLTPLRNRILPLYQNGNLSKTAPDYWAAKILAHGHPNHFDRGIFSIYFFNLIKINQNEGIFQPTGTPHAYLEGQNIELMANSDNVLRGGLTPKCVDINELLKVIQFSGTIPEIIKPNRNDGENIYTTPANDFVLSKIELKEKDTYCNTAFSLEIMIVIDGEIKIGNSQNFKKGEVIAIFAGEDYSLESIANHSILFKAAVPKI